MATKIPWVGWMLVPLLFLGDLAEAQETPASPTPFSQVIVYRPVPQADVEDLIAGLAPGAKMVFIPASGKVLLQGNREQVELVAASVADLVREASKPQPNVRIEILTSDNSVSKDQGADVKWNVGGHDVRAGNVPGNTSRVGVGFVNNTTTQSSSMNQFLVVQSGLSAAIDISQTVPFVDYFYTYARSCGYVIPEIRWERVGTSLAIFPVVQGNLVRVQVIPRITTLLNGKTGEILFKELATTVTVQNGATLDIGGFQGADSQFNASFLSGVSSRRGGSSTTIRLRATILPPMQQALAPEP
jgi:hypothetical protein